MVFDPSRARQPPPREIPINNYSLNISSPTIAGYSEEQYGTTNCITDVYGSYAWADPEIPQSSNTETGGDIYGSHSRNSGVLYGNVQGNPTYAYAPNAEYASEANLTEYGEEQASFSRQPSVPSPLRFQNSFDGISNGVSNNNPNSEYAPVYDVHSRTQPAPTERVRKLTPYPNSFVPKPNQFFSKTMTNYHEPDVYLSPSEIPADNEITEVYPHDSTSPSTPGVEAFENKEYYSTQNSCSPSSRKFINFGHSMDEPENTETPIPAPRRHSSAAAVSSSNGPRRTPTLLNIKRPENIIHDESDDENVLGGNEPHINHRVDDRFRSQSTPTAPSVNQLPPKYHARPQVRNRVSLPSPQPLNPPLRGTQSSGNVNGSTSAALLRSGTAIELNDKPWYNKTIDKDEAEEKLNSRKKVGCYVVRNSRYRDGLNFALSFYYLTQSGSGKVKHLSISFLENTHQWQVGNDQSRDNPAFNSVVTLVEHYIKHGFCLDDGTSIDLREILDTRKKSWIHGIKIGGKK